MLTPQNADETEGNGRVPQNQKNLPAKDWMSAQGWNFLEGALWDAYLIWQALILIGQDSAEFCKEVLQQSGRKHGSQHFPGGPVVKTTLPLQGPLASL